MPPPAVAVAVAPAVPCDDGSAVHGARQVQDVSDDVLLWCVPGGTAHLGICGQLPLPVAL